MLLKPAAALAVSEASRKAIPPTQLFFFFLVFLFGRRVRQWLRDHAGCGFGSATKGLDETSDSLIALHD